MQRAILIKTTILIVLFAIVQVVGGYAQERGQSSEIPNTISYQGVITSPTGNAPTDGRYNVVVSLYADSQGQELVWKDTYNTTIAGGLFNLYLGNGMEPLPGPGVMDKPLWVGTQLDGTPEMRPLTPLTASPYALNVTDMAITANKLATGAVTADKVDMNYVSEIRINGQKVTGKAGVLNLKSSDDIALKYDEITQSVKIESATTSDDSKSSDGRGPKILGTAADSWGMEGDGVAANVDSDDWIGTSNAAGNSFYNFIVKVNSEQIMKYQPSGGPTTPNTNTPNIVGGHEDNDIAITSIGSVIGGGGAGGPRFNEIWDGEYNTIGGGDNNKISSGIGLRKGNTVSGGYDNSIVGLLNNTIGGGIGNDIISDYVTISGGRYNSSHGLATTIGGGELNRVRAYYSTIGGGLNNLIDDEYAVITGGQNNNIASKHGTIGGGELNDIVSFAPHATIGGGISNEVWSSHGAVLGGNTNVIDAGSSHASIGGGQDNSVSSNSMHGVISGGQDNVITTSSPASTISGGSSNSVAGQFSTIAGGTSNDLAGEYSSLGGGFDNTIQASHSTIAGGESNTIIAPYGAIGGGFTNAIQSLYGTVAGGSENTINTTSDYGTIGGGRENVISANSQSSVISGGYLNIATGQFNTISGGTSHDVTGDYISIGGGNNNSILGSNGTISGGEQHVITALHGTIGGGSTHKVFTQYGTVGGGIDNQVAGFASTIAGGGNNRVLPTTVTGGGTVGGGESNWVQGDYGTISGGKSNYINTGTEYGTIGGGEGNFILGSYATIPGGDQLSTTASYAQVAVGFLNDPRGSVGVRPAPGGLTDDPLFMVGNGDVNTLTPSNAFEVSYNGHSIVSDVNGSGGATVAPGKASYSGATYIDNVIYAWGDVPWQGFTLPQNLVPVDDFGVASITQTAVGTYTVTLNVADRTGNPITLNSASITATLVEPHPQGYTCGFISTTRIGTPGPNQFTIRTYKNGCIPEDYPFMFKVTGRP